MRKSFSRLNSKADGEEQEDDADLRQHVDKRSVVDQGQAFRTDEKACQEVAHDGHEPDPMAEIGRRDAHDEEQDQLGQEGELGGDGENPGCGFHVCGVELRCDV